MARSLPKVCPFLVTVDLKLKWPELPRPTLRVPEKTTIYIQLYVYEALDRSIPKLRNGKSDQNLHVHMSQHSLAFVVSDIFIVVFHITESADSIYIVDMTDTQ